MNNLAQFATDILMRNPRFSNNPQAQEYLRIIREGDREKGERVATNLCNTFGVSQEQAVADARKFFHI